jgi:hypothetical protein
MAIGAALSVVLVGGLIVYFFYSGDSWGMPFSGR